MDAKTFEEVQEQLLKNRVGKKCNIKSASNSLLAGKIYDDKDNRMSPSHSNTKNKRYRYYVSQAMITTQKAKAGSVTKIPSGEIEKFVAESVSEFLLDSEKMQNYFNHLDIAKQKAILVAVKNINDFSEPKLLRAILNKVVISKNSVEIILCAKALLATLDNLSLSIDPPEETRLITEFPIVILKEIKITKTSQSGNVLIISSGLSPAPSPNPYLINAIVKSHYWHKLMIEGKVKSSKDIQKLEGLTDNTYVKDILRLQLIPPQLTESILSGTHSSDLSVDKLLKYNFSSN